MKFLPIVGRELRVASRRQGTYWLRMLVALTLVVLASWVFLVSRHLLQHEIAQTIFYTLTGGLMLYVLMAGLRATADCLSEEKRDGTLGLLFLTNLRGYDVVLGKLAANSLAVFYCVLAVLPVLAVPLLMGGVAAAEFWRVALVLVNTLFFSLTAGMLASACCKNHRGAVGLTFLVILAVTAGSPALGFLLWWKQNWRNYEYLFLLPSPVFSYAAAIDQVFKSPVGKGFFWSVGLVHLFGWLNLALASYITPRSWQDRAATVGGVRRQQLLRNLAEGAGVVRDVFRTRALDRNAFFWLATRPRLRPLWSWLPLAVAAVAWIWGLLKFAGDWMNVGIYSATAILLNATMKAMIGAEAGRRLAEDRKIGALELLLSTPLNVQQILHGQRLALQRQFLFPVAVMFLVDLMMMLAGLSTTDLTQSEERAYWTWTWLLALIVFVADCEALYWRGMWTGLATRNPKHAFGSSVVPILVLPWLGFGIVATIINLLPRDVQRAFNWDGWPLLLWFSFSLLTDLAFGVAARHKLLTQFRTVAAQRYQARASFWQRVFGKGDPPAAADR